MDATLGILAFYNIIRCYHDSEFATFWKCKIDNDLSAFDIDW